MEAEWCNSFMKERGEKKIVYLSIIGGGTGYQSSTTCSANWEGELSFVQLKRKKKKDSHFSERKGCPFPFGYSSFYAREEGKRHRGGGH